MLLWVLSILLAEIVSGNDLLVQVTVKAKYDYLQVRPSLSSSTPLESPYVRYLFYNYDNLAFRSTLHNLGKLIVPPDFMKLICDVAQSFEKEGR